MPIIISKNGKDAKRGERTRFKKEEELLKYISENPDCIPIEDIKEDAQFIILDREFPVDVGSIDALGVDSEGDIYIIETKHLKEPGGEQNKSMSELIDFIQQQEENPNFNYVSFIDGVYFNLLINPPESKRERENKIQQQRKDIDDALDEFKNKFFVNTAGLISLLKDLFKEVEK